MVKRDGIAGLWEYLKDQFQDLKATVMDAIMDIIQSQVIQAGIKWILSLLSPVGAFVKAIMAIIDVVKFFIQRAAQIGELVKAFTQSVSAIASGKVGAVAGAIENALGKAIPVLIGLLASILGISGLADKVLGVIRKIRQRITAGITKFWNFVKAKGKNLLGKLQTSKLSENTKGLYDKGQEKLLDERDSVYDYAMGTISFTAADGSRHKIYPKSKADPKNIMLASTPKPIEVQLDSEMSISKEQGDKDNVSKLQKAKDYYQNDIKTIISGLQLIQEHEKSSKRDVAGSNVKAQEKVEKLAHERDQNFAILKTLLEQTTFSHGEKTKVKTKTKWQDSGVAGDYVEASPLTYLEGDYKGAGPGSANPRGWSFAQNLNAQHDGIVYIRGHMLNDGLHGPNTNWNLKPISNRMNREMDQRIENHAKRENKEKHKILYYRAEVEEYHKGDRNGAGAFPKRLIVEWGHLMKDGKFDAEGDKKQIQYEKFEQSESIEKSIPINELGESLLVPALKKHGISEQFTKEVILYLKNNTNKKRFEHFEDFQDHYIEKIAGTKRENAAEYSILRMLDRNNNVNF